MKITAHQEHGPALIIIEGMSNPEEVDVLSFFCKTDTACEVHLALADSRSVAAFENIQEYLPEKKLTSFWQKAEYPLRHLDIDARDLRRVYVQIIPLAETDAVLYLDDFILEKIETKQPGYQIVYHFNNSVLKNIFNDEPSASTRGAEIELAVTTEDHYGASGGALRCTFTTYENPAEIFFPMTAHHKANYLEIKHISFALRSESPDLLGFLPETAALRKKMKAGEAYSARRYQIALSQNNWQKINLPLLEGDTDFYGLRIILPAKTSGVFYLDDLSLN